MDSIDFKGMEPLFAHLKAELDEGIGDEPGDSTLYESSLDRVLAATQRQESISPACKNHPFLLMNPLNLSRKRRVRPPERWNLRR